MLLNVSHIQKAFGEDVILNDVTFGVDDNQKFAIVGNNGSGKSTLLKIIVGQMKAEDGDVTLKKDATFGYLAQYQDDEYNDSIIENVLSARADLIEIESKLANMEAQMTHVSESDMNAFLDEYHKLQNTFDRLGGYTFRSEATGVLKGLGFVEADFNRKMTELSGGQKTRVALGRLLVKSPDLLLLDEPINHLDLSSIMWLEGYLANYKGAVIIVAHDRYFLDKIADHVVDLSYGRCEVYKGNYSAFVTQKEQRQLTYMRSFEKQQKEIAHQQEVIDKLQSFNREKSIKRAESRKKLLDKMDVMESPDFYEAKMRLTLETNISSGNDVLFFDEVTKKYGEKTIFENLSFDVHRGDRIAILGDNGTGKTTILKVINGLTDFSHGEITIGTNVVIGYYDQEQQGLDDRKTIFDELHDAYPDMTETKVRNTLAAFLFTGDDVYKRISSLSGGERGRVSLAKLMLSKSNFLILDEPTNHLDMDSKQMLEDAINEYEGTLLYVSHDRYFVNRTASTILELHDGTLTKYLGNYDDYIAKKESLEVYNARMNSSQTSSTGVSTDEVALNATVAKLDFKEQKRIESEKRKLANQIKGIEDEIASLEDESAKIDEEFGDPANATNSAKLNELSAKQQKIKERLEELYSKWEELSEVVVE